MLLVPRHCRSPPDERWRWLRRLLCTHGARTTLWDNRSLPAHCRLVAGSQLILPLILQNAGTRSLESRMPPGKLARRALACAGLALCAAASVFATDPPAPRAPLVNAQPGARIPGKFIWFDCVTADPYASKAFYGAVFGWDFHSIGSGTGRYTLIENRARNIGGMHFRPRGNGPAQGSRWLSLMSVDDPALAAQYVASHGGKVVVAPTVFEGRGVHALFRDDDGALFGVLKSDTGDPPEGAAVPGEFVWLDLFTRDPKKAAEFYRGLAGYDVAVKETPAQTVRVGLSTGGVIRASILVLPKEVTDPG